MNRSGAFYLDDFIVSADGTDCAPAFMRLQQVGSSDIRTPLEMIVQPRSYRMSRRLDVIVTRLWIHAGHGGFAGTQSAANGYGIPTFTWDAGAPSAGIESHYPGTYFGGTYGTLVLGADANARGDGLRITGMALVGPGVSTTYVGATTDFAVRPRTAGLMEDCWVTGFRGGGLYINASVSGSPTGNLGNVNGFKCIRTRFYDCGGPGLYLNGGDANACVYESCSVNDCGEDMPNRRMSFTTAMSSRQCTEVVITTAVNSTLYRVVVNGTNCDYTSDADATITEIRDGLIAAINASAQAGVVTAVAIRAASLMVYGDNNSTFTLTESSANMTTATIATTTSSTDVVLLGAAQPSATLVTGDVASIVIGTGGWGGVLRGVIRDLDTANGFARLDTSLDRAAQVAPSGSTIALVSGTTWRLTMPGRTNVAHQLNSRNLRLFGAVNEANNSPAAGFPITMIQAGQTAATSVDVRVVRAINSTRYWVVINGTLVAFTSNASATLTNIRDDLITAITAAAISGVTAALQTSDTLRISGSNVLVTPSEPTLVVNAGPTTQTRIEYTNASGVADSGFLGQYTIDRTQPQGLATGTFWLEGRMVQAYDSPLIFSSYDSCAVNGPGISDGYFCTCGASVFKNCYTEGSLLAILGPSNYAPGGRMNPNVEGPTLESSTFLMARPMLAASYLDPSGYGAMVARLGGSQPDTLLEFERRMPSTANQSETISLAQAVTAQGADCWEWLTDRAEPTLRLPQGGDTRLGGGEFAVSRADLFVGYGDGSLPAARTHRPNGAGGFTNTNDSAGTSSDSNTQMGMIGWRFNGSFNVVLETVRVYTVAGATNATPISLSISGNHNLAAGDRIRLLVRNVQGNTAANGYFDALRNASGSWTLRTPTNPPVNVAGNGTYVSAPRATGIAVHVRFRAFGIPAFDANGALALADGTWIVGDRFIQVMPVGGETVEWECTASGTGTAATWQRVAVAGDQPNGEIYWSTPAATAIPATTADTLAAGTTTLQGGGTQFDMPANGRLRYIGAEARRFRVSARLSADFATAGTRLMRATIYASTAGTPAAVASSIQERTIIQPARVGVVLECNVVLLPNQFVEVWIANMSADGDDITVQRANLTAVAI